jgi:hypothetical protein
MRQESLRVLRRDDHDPIPELLVPLMVTEAVRDDVGLTDIAARVPHHSSSPRRKHTPVL